tara:strand:- start:67 stop:411 length:345 start_codon:yes stop_codon:yes gene_type:complete
MILASRIFGYTIILLSLIGIVAGMVLCLRPPGCGTVFVYLIFAFLPLLIGLAGTAMGNTNIDIMIDTQGEKPSEAVLEADRALARVNTYMGICGTAPLVLLGMVSMALRTSRNN